MNKPAANNTMLLDAIVNKNIKIYVLDLADISIKIKNEKEVYVIIDLPSNVIDEKEGEFVLTISNDPDMDYAGDWTHLGHSRLKITMKKAKRLINKKLMFKMELKDIEVRPLMPERKLWRKDDSTRFNFYS